MFDCGIVVAIVALGIAIYVLRRAQRLERVPEEIAALRADVAALRGELSRRENAAAPPGTTQRAAPEAAPSAGPVLSVPGPARPASPPWAAEPAESLAAPTPAPAPATPATPAMQVPPLPSEQPRVRLEERLAARLPVWIGSVALFLAGAFLVKYSFDRGLLGPGARVTLGLLFGVVLLLGGEVLRKRADRIGQGLSASGIAVLYASLLAATSLYGFVSRPVGFGLLALTTATAVVLSLRQGVLIAVLGLVGGFVTPALIGSEEPNASALFAYLFLLQAGLFAAARPRRSWPLAALTVGGGVLWSGAWLAFFFRPGDELPIGLFLAGSLALTSLLWRSSAHGVEVVFGAGATALALLVALAGKAGFGPTEWGFLALVAAGCFALAWREPRYEPLPAMAVVAGLVTLVAWADAGDPSPRSLGWVALGYGGLCALCAFLLGYRLTTAGADGEGGAAGASDGAVEGPGEVAVEGPGEVAVEETVDAARDGLGTRGERTLWLSAASAVLYFFAAWFLLDAPPRFGWGPVALALGAVFVALGLPLAGRAPRQSLAAPAAAATVFVAAAVPFELEHFSLSVAWALEVAALAWIESRLRVNVLRWLAGALGAIVLFRLLVNPTVGTYDPGPWPIVNWVLYGYGVPALAFAAAAALWRRCGPSWWDRAGDGAATALAAWLCALEVRAWFHAPVVTAGEPMATNWAYGMRFEVAEAGAIVTLWLALGLALLVAARRGARPFVATCGETVVLGALALALPLLGIVANPWLVERAVGATPVLNAVLFAYGAPAALAFFNTREFARRGERNLSRVTAVASLLLVLGCVVLLVRQAFHGTVLATGTTSAAELYTYSITLVLFATVLLVMAIATRGDVLRWGSLAVMLLAVAKVFLYDLSELRDLYRVLSFFGLGVSLLVIAYLYQRFVFRARA